MNDSGSEEDDKSESYAGESKRVLANRQSAHRSRLRKLQYIQDLENNVNRIQTEISQIQPQLTFLREKYSGQLSETFIMLTVSHKAAFCQRSSYALRPKALSLAETVKDTTLIYKDLRSMLQLCHLNCLACCRFSRTKS